MADVLGSDSYNTDVHLEMFCEVCRKQKDRHTIAEGFCPECVKYMCKDCLIFHQEFHPAHGHQDAENMPTDFCLESCTTHNDEIIKYYCEKCDQFYCDICVKEHDKCSTAHHLPRYVKNLEKRPEFIKFSEILDNMTSSISSIEDVIDSDNETIKNCSQGATAAVENVQKEVNRKFEELKAEIKRTIAPMKVEDQHKVQSLTQQTATVKHTLDSLKTEIDRDVSNSHRSRLFIQMHSTQLDIKDMEERLKEIEEECLTPLHRYHFQSSTQIQNILSAESVLGTVLLDSETKRTAEHEGNLTVQNATTPLFGILVDTSKPYGMCLVHSKFLVVVGDFDSSLLKVINITTNSIIAVIRRKTLKHVPRGITTINDGQVAFTLPDNGQIHIYSITTSGEVSSSGNIIAGPGCHGIAHNGKNFIISYTYPKPSIKVLNMNGEILKTFPTNTTREEIFQLPCSLSLSPDRCTLYVADKALNTISSLSMKGEIIRIYRIDRLSTPTCVTVDKAGSVYVCGNKSQNIIQLSENLAEVKVLLQQKNQITNYQCVHFADGKLYVGKENTTNIEVYNIVPEAEKNNLVNQETDKQQECQNVTIYTRHSVS